MARIMISLSEMEIEVLKKLASMERRNPRDQAAMLIREQLILLEMLREQEYLPAHTEELSTDN